MSSVDGWLSLRKEDDVIKSTERTPYDQMIYAVWAHLAATKQIKIFIDWVTCRFIDDLDIHGILLKRLSHDSKSFQVFQTTVCNAARSKKCLFQLKRVINNVWVLCDVSFEF